MFFLAAKQLLKSVKRSAARDSGKRARTTTTGTPIRKKKLRRTNIRRPSTALVQAPSTAITPKQQDRFQLIRQYIQVYVREHNANNNNSNSNTPPNYALLHDVTQRFYDMMVQADQEDPASLLVVLNAIVAHNALFYFCELLPVHQHPPCQMVAARTLAYLAAGPRADAVATSNAVVFMIPLLQHEEEKVRLQVVHCYQHLAENRMEYRDGLLKKKEAVDAL